MRQFIAFVHKEFYHIFRDIRTMMILLGMPIMQIIIFGFALSTDIKDIRVSILNPNEDIVSRKIIERIDASEYFIVDDRYLHTGNEIEKEFKEGKADMVIVFSEQFSSKLLHTGEAGIQIIADATDPNTAKTFTQYAASIIAASQQELALGNNIPMHITSSIKLLYNPQMKSAYNFVPGVMGLILMLICAMMTSISIVREKETGTMEVLLVSPMRPIFIILAKAVPYFVLSCVNLFTILILSVYVLHVPIAGSLFWLIIVSLLFIFVSLSLGLLISTLTKTQVAAMLASGMILMMPTMLLSGMIFPIESMPPILQWISHIIPAKWYIMTVKKLMIEGVNVSLAWQEISILMFMAIILITISLKKFKNRLE
ncbi:MAG: ABC transporter permease [Tannerella sp.]|uniref:ABC transporter permease n=1 Tax=uncultured Coprobacter sp. TaxID=1720550 RepID=UPI00261F7551|nr:ABC transporter permease [uncultured Coprobacter sp.]MBS6267754.1 ABC transporter permease [Tannerella sp.]